MKKYIVSLCAAALVCIPALAADAPQGCPMSKGACPKAAGGCQVKKDAKAGACCAAKKATAGKQQAGSKGASDLVKR